MSRANDESHIAAVRSFNRFYTRRLGVLEQQFLDGPYSLTEARVLYEIAHPSAPSARDVSAKEIGAQLGLDAGYLSRIIQNFAEKGLISRRLSPADKRQYRLSLTAKGRLAFGRLNRGSHDDIAKMLGEVSPIDADRVVASMADIQRTLEGADAARPPATLRGPRPGDMGWVVQSHGALYAAEYGFDSSFEALVAEIAATFLRSFDASRERCWIAEIDGDPVGSLFLVRHADDIAKLRLMLVDPAGRGQRLGQRMLAEAIVFARQCGYRAITLWTQSILISARRIYQDAGFVLVASEPHRSFGQSLIGETWELTL